MFESCSRRGIIFLPFLGLFFVVYLHVADRVKRRYDLQSGVVVHGGVHEHTIDLLGNKCVVHMTLHW